MPAGREKNHTLKFFPSNFDHDLKWKKLCWSCLDVLVLEAIMHSKCSVGILIPFYKINLNWQQNKANSKSTKRKSVTENRKNFANWCNISYGSWTKISKVSTRKNTVCALGGSIDNWNPLYNFPSTAHSDSTVCTNINSLLQEALAREIIILIATTIAYLGNVPKFHPSGH